MLRGLLPLSETYSISEELFSEVSGIGGRPVASSHSVFGSNSGSGTAGWIGSTGDLGIGDGDLLGYG